MTEGMKDTALGLVKARLNRMASDTSLDSYFTQRIEAAAKELEGTGIRLTDSADDLMLLVDYSVWQYQNRDSTGAMPDWLRLRRRERWLRQNALNAQENQAETDTQSGTETTGGTETDPGGEGNDP